jgi:hypothetical protein
MKGRLKCNADTDVESPPQGESGTIFFVLLSPEFTTVKSKHLASFIHKFGDDSDIHVIA